VSKVNVELRLGEPFLTYPQAERSAARRETWGKVRHSDGASERVV